MDDLIQRNGTAIATLEQLPEKKQRQAIISEVQNITDEVLKCLDTADVRKSEIKELQRFLKETDQVKKLTRFRKEVKELNSAAHALLMELRGIKRLVKRVQPDLLPELTHIKELRQR
jgi:dsDNA-specific endonuclease/ATPase MutS2